MSFPAAEAMQPMAKAPIIIYNEGVYRETGTETHRNFAY